MNQVNRFCGTASQRPEAGQLRAGGERQTLDPRIWQQRQCFQYHLATGKVPDRMTMDADIAFVRYPGRQSRRITAPERFQGQGIGGMHINLAAMLCQITSEPGEVTFRAPQRRGVSLDQMHIAW